MKSNDTIKRGPRKCSWRAGATASPVGTPTQPPPSTTASQPAHKITPQSRRRKDEYNARHRVVLVRCGAIIFRMFLSSCGVHGAVHNDDDNDDAHLILLMVQAMVRFRCRKLSQRYAWLLLRWCDRPSDSAFALKCHRQCKRAASPHFCHIKTAVAFTYQR